MSNNNDSQKQLVQSIVQDYIKETGDKNPDRNKIEAFIKRKGGDKYIQKKASAIQSSKQKAKHGAKLNYIRKLSHKCADDEELYYYKKGGSVDCGCRKKVMKDGGEVKDSSDAVKNFKDKTGKEKQGKKPASKEDTKNIVINKCGSKVKKNKFGGFFKIISKT